MAEFENILKEIEDLESESSEAETVLEESQEHQEEIHEEEQEELVTEITENINYYQYDNAEIENALSNMQVQLSEINQNIMLLADTPATPRTVPTSQYGWSSDYVIPDEYEYFILTDVRICGFNGSATYNPSTETLYIYGNGFYQNKSGYYSEWTGDRKHANVGSVLLSNIDVYNDGQVVFSANFKFEETGETDEPIPTTPPEHDIINTVPLWESDILDYGVTDGLLLLILLVLILGFLFRR